MKINSTAGEVKIVLNKKEMGKKSRAAGARFEKRVRFDLEKKGWIVDKWTNNVEFIPKYEGDKEFVEEIGREAHILRMPGKLVPAKPKFVYNPTIKRRVMISNSSGFPDFIAFQPRAGLVQEILGKNTRVCGSDHIIGVEAKMNGYLDNEECKKCDWLLDNKIFGKIIVASKGEKRGEIVYKEYGT